MEKTSIFKQDISVQNTNCKLQQHQAKLRRDARITQIKKNRFTNLYANPSANYQQVFNCLDIFLKVEFTNDCVQTLKNLREILADRELAPCFEKVL